MSGIDSYLAATLAIVGIIGMTIIFRNWRHATVSSRRMFRMMLTCGIGEATARNANQLLDLDMKEVRKRCRRCQTQNICDRWLNGETVPGNDFCPNVAHFLAAVDTGEFRLEYEPSRRPGRRLD